MSSFASTKKIDPSFNDSLHIASEGVAVLCLHSPVQAVADLHDRVYKGGLYFVSMTVGMCLQVAPDKMLIWIEGRAPRRPRVHGDEVPDVLLLMDLLETGNGAWACCPIQGLSLARLLIQGIIVCFMT